MKKVLKFLFLSLCTYVSVQAQTPGTPIGGIIVKGGKNPGGGMLINVGGGISNPSSDTKKTQLLGSGSSFNAGFYLPVFSFGPDADFTFGPNISATYSKFSGDVSASPKYNITGQSAPPTGNKSANGNGSGFTTEAGFHANFSFGKITLSPVLNAGYLSFKQDGFKVTQSNQVNGKTYNFYLYNQKEIKEHGFALIPKFRVSYFPGKLGLYLESNYTMGPDITSSQTTLQPLGSGSNIDGSYQFDQLMAGKQVVSDRHTPFHNIGFNFGVSYAIRRRSIPTNSNPGYNARKRVVVLKSNRTNPLYENSGDTKENPLSEQKLIYAHDYSITDGEILSYLHTDQLVIKKGTYSSDFSNNPFGDITLELATPISAKGITQSGIKRSISEPTSAKGITESGIKKNEPATSSERAIKEVGMKRTEAATSSERAIREVGMKRTEAAPSNERAIKEVGMKRTESTPSNERAIKEVGMKRTESAPTNEKAINQAGMKRQQFSGIRCDADCKEEGDYCFTCKKSSSTALFYEFEIIPVIENEMITHIILSNNSVSRNGVPLTGYNPSGQPQNQNVVNTSKSNTKDRVATNPGATGGTNPTGQPQNQSIINTSKSNTKDRVATNPEATGGTNPTGQPQNQSIINTTKSNTKDRVGARPGEPIGGIVVKGGRNPSGQMKMVSNSQGEFTFQNATTADFKFTIEMPESTANNANAARPGEPIGGIIVKGGRNPGGQMFTTTANGNGQVEFKNLPAGNYKFMISAPTDTKAYENFRKGWDGSVKGSGK